MEYHFYRKPWFLMLVAFVIFGCGYIVADDARIERENKFGCVWSKADSPDKPIKIAAREDK